MIELLRKDDLMLSAVKSPSEVPEEAWNNELVRLVAQCYSRFSAQRVLGQTLNELMAHHPPGVHPTLRQIVEVLEKRKRRWGSREADYIESIVWVLRDLLNATGKMWDYSSSNQLDVLTNTPGLAIIELEDLPHEHFTFIVTYVARWIYFKRLYGGHVLWT